MARRITRQFGDLPVFLRQAILAVLGDLEEKDFDEFVITDIQPPKCGKERPATKRLGCPLTGKRDLGGDPEPGHGYHLDAGSSDDDHWAV